jgi:hypothetical protein
VEQSTETVLYVRDPRGRAKCSRPFVVVDVLEEQLDCASSHDLDFGLPDASGGVEHPTDERVALVVEISNQIVGDTRSGTSVTQGEPPSIRRTTCWRAR